VDVLGVEFHPLWTKDILNEGKILYTPLCKVCMSLCCTFGHPHFFDDFIRDPYTEFLEFACNSLVEEAGLRTDGRKCVDFTQGFLLENA